MEPAGSMPLARSWQGCRHENVDQDRNHQLYRVRGGSLIRTSQKSSICDFLVVGAGSAGCVVARVLAEAGYRVRLIEAGQPDALRRRPAEYLHAFGSDQDWRLQSTGQLELAGRQLIQPRGRGIGGSTRINAMIWYPPRATDLAMLHRHGGIAWHPDALLPSLTTVTHWVNPQFPRWIAESSRRYLQSIYPAIDPPHAFLRMAGSPASGPQGRRTAGDLIDPWLSSSSASETRGPIEFVTAHVDHVVFDGDSAIGVMALVEHETNPTFIAADLGVILCGGAFASPAMLIRSGIGPAESLRQLGISLRCDSPEVGNRLADHLIMPVIFGLNHRDRFPTDFSPADLARWQIAATGPLASNLAEAGGIYAIPPSESRHPQAATPEFQVHTTPTHYLTYPSAGSVAAMTVGVNLCQPQSIGSITLQSSHPLAPPHIDPGYLGVASDLEHMISAVQIARQIVAESPLQDFVTGEKLPGPERVLPEAIARAIRRFSQTLYHPVGTCRLGTDSASVIDSSCQVRGAERLHVIDASVFPEITSINPNATTMMLAHHVATKLVRRGE